MVRAEVREQASFDEESIENADLEKALKEWVVSDRQRKAVAAKATERKNSAKAILDTLELVEGVYRCGAVKITINSREEKHIEYDTKAGLQTRFSYVADNE